MDSDSTYKPQMSMDTGNNLKNLDRNQWKSGYSEEYHYNLPTNAGDPLNNIYKEMREYDGNMCSAWRDEIANLLLFAALFSATVTSFTVNSYKWLQEDYTKTSATLLFTISSQLGVLANNTTSSLPSPVQAPFTPNSRSVRVNTFWFMSLVMSLSAAVLGILCLQWLREFTRKTLLPSTDAVPIRQLCYDGLFDWKVPQLISSLSVILQASVLLFFAGVLDLLWSLHNVVAGIVTVLVGWTVIVVIFTTLAPGIQLLCVKQNLSWCPYKSPFSLGFILLGKLVKRTLYWRPKGITHKKIPGSWTDVELECHQTHLQDGANIPGFVRALEWTIDHLRPRQNQTVAQDIFHSLRSFPHRDASRVIMYRWVKGERERERERERELGEIAINFTAQDAISDHIEKLPDEVQYDLLMGKFLKRCVPPDRLQEQLLSELHVRCLNTVGAKSGLSMQVEFPPLEALDDKEREILFQTIATTLDHIKICTDVELHSENVPADFDHARLLSVGRALGHYIRHTQIEQGNAIKCKAILLKLKSVLDHAQSRHDDALWIRLSAFLLHDVDLRRVETWRNSVISAQSGQSPPEFVPFVEDILRTVYRKPELKHKLVESNPIVGTYLDRVLQGQLHAFHESQPYSFSSYAH